MKCEQIFKENKWPELILLVSQRFCKEDEKFQIIFGYQLDQGRLREWAG